MKQILSQKIRISNVKKQIPVGKRLSLPYFVTKSAYFVALCTQQMLYCPIMPSFRPILTCFHTSRLSSEHLPSFTGRLFHVHSFFWPPSIG